MNGPFSDVRATANATRLLVLPTAVVALLGAIACNASDEQSSGSERESGKTSEPAPVDMAAARELSDLKAKYGAEQIRADDGLANRFRTLSARTFGLDPNEHQKKLNAVSKSAPLAGKLTDKQVGAWKKLSEVSRGELSLSWDLGRATPATIELPVTLGGASGPEARLDLENRYGAAIADTFERGGNDRLVPLVEHTFAPPENAEAQVYRIRYRREHRGLPVFGDSYEVTLRTAADTPTKWVSFVSAQWAKDLDTLGLVAELSPTEAAEIARDSGELADARAPATPELGVCTQKIPSTLCYQVRLGNDERGAWLYYVSATTGEILEHSNQVAADSGTLVVGVGRPLEGNGKFWRKLPNATIYKNSKLYAEAATPGRCDNPITSEIAGHTNQVLGATNYNGGYSNLGDPSDPSDKSWVVDFRGPYVKDVVAPEPQDPTTLSIDFTAGGTAFVPFDTVNLRSRRGEFFYLLNYSSQFYRNAGVMQYEPLRFYYEDFGSANCQNPGNPQNCCGGNAFINGCFEMICGEDMSTSAHESAERQFRKVMFHEQGHTLRMAAGGLFNLDCTAATGTGNGTEIGCWEEGRADLSGMVLSHFEKARPEYRPDRTYPADLTSAGGEAKYRGGSIFEAIYADYIFRTGVASGMKDVLFNVALPNADTRMVGACSDQNGDTHVVANECPTNSFYRHLLGATQATNFGQNLYEVSQAFHAHVTDADVGAAGVQAFPWADELPNVPNRGPYVPLEMFTTFLATTGPDEGSGNLRLSSISDLDTFTFLARGGEAYGVTTESLSPGTDTMVTVFRSDGTIAAFNDDCYPGTGNWSSCVNFTPSTTGYYRVRVAPYDPSPTGPGATYQLRVSMFNDDVADNFSGAAAYAMRTDGAWRLANLTSGDQDFFKVAVGTAQDLTFQVCSYSMPVDMEMYDQNGFWIQTLSQSAGCGAPSVAQQSVGAAIYFFRIVSPTTQADSYFFRVMATNPDLDASGPFYLRSTDIGRTYASQFETGSDQDWYAFFASSEGQSFTIETLDQAINVDTVIEVYAPSNTLYGRVTPPAVDGSVDVSGAGYGQWMVKDDDGGFGSRASRLNFIAPVPGTYTVRVRNKLQSQGEYAIMFEEGTTAPGAGWNTPYP